MIQEMMTASCGLHLPEDRSMKRGVVDLEQCYSVKLQVQHDRPTVLDEYQSFRASGSERVDGNARPCRQDISPVICRWRRKLFPRLRASIKLNLERTE